MSWTTAVSLIIGLALMASAAWYALRRAKGRALEHIWGYDCVALTLARHPWTRGSLMRPVLIWVTIFTIAGVIVPLLTDGTAYFEHPSGLVVTFNYTVLIPVLLGAYMYLLRAADSFFTPSTLKDLGLCMGPRHGTKACSTPPDAARADDASPPKQAGAVRRALGLAWRLLRQPPVFLVFLILPALVIQFMVIQAAEDGKWPLRPWVGGDHVLTLEGSVYWALRGLDGMMALGLTFSMNYIVFRILVSLRSMDPTKMYTKALRVRPEVRSLGAGLVLAFFAASAAIAVNGLGIYLEQPLRPQGGIGDAAAASTWILWAMFAILMLLTLVACFIKLHVILTKGCELRQERAVRALESDGSRRSAVLPGDPKKPRTAKNPADYWEGSANIRSTFASVHTWPLPRVAASFGFLAALALQVVGWYLNSRL